MSAITIVMMVVILGIFWGGFAFLMTKSLFSEREKES